MKKNRLLSLLQPKAKPVIITIHGYGRRRSHEMDNLAAWAKDERFTVIQFDLYDLFDEEDCDPKQWLARAEAVVKTHCAGKQPVYLLGFSMGGVIASWLASRYPIKKLALIAPHATVNIIRNFQVVEKKKLVMPERIEGLAKCMNPKCITNHQPVKTKFTVIGEGDKISLLCHYCEKISDIKSVF